MAQIQLILANGNYDIRCQVQIKKLCNTRGQAPEIKNK